MMTLGEFHNGLRILTSIDFDELIEAEVFDEEEGEVEWPHFRSDPYKWLILADADQAEKLWALMVKRGVGVTPAVIAN